jgi:uncharacterized membrane protein HdeD (DUF308 family)
MVNFFEIFADWVIQDVIVLLLGVITIVYIINHESFAASKFLEMFSFIFLYAGIYENLATVMEWYKFGRSILMLFNVPITVPLMEYLT